MAKDRRTLIIGLDGVPFEMIGKFTAEGIMPNVGRILAGGLFTPMRSSIPEISSVAWSSIITGTGPAQHGIFGFTDLRPGSYDMRFPNFSDLKAPPFWETSGEPSVIINVPSTYPVRPMNGVHISGFVSIDMRKSVHPESLLPGLREIDYRLDVDSEKAHADLDAFIADLDATLTARIKAIELLWDYTNWRTFMAIFTGTDRLLHFLYEAYEDIKHRHHRAFAAHFTRIDEAIGWMASRLTAEDSVVMLSDHGFEKLELDVYVNRLLEKEGFLKFEQGGAPRIANIGPQTKAFALDPARIYVNLKDKYPRGGAVGGDRDAVLADLEQLFSSLELEGKKAVRHIFRKEQVYEGPYMENAPDMVLIGNKGFNLRGSMAAGEISGKGPFTGKHTYNGAFLFTNRPEATELAGGNPSVIEAGRLIKSLAGG